MDIVYIIIALLLAIIVSDILNKIFPRIPIIFIQILLGTLISYFPFFHEFEFNPEIFMLVVIKPLIFSESQKFSLKELKENFRPIISLSLSLVLLTVLITGFLVNIFIPKIPLSVTFILASIIIPTNSGIVKTLSTQLKFPKHIFHILEGESLFNESIAMIIYELALAVALTNEFHFSETVYEFIFAILGGILVGSILSYIIIKLRFIITRNNLENPAMMVVIQVITPFVVYTIAHHYLHVSGIIAIIVTGIFHSIERPLLNLKSTKLQVISNNTWDILDYILDGLIAVILGLILPSVLSHIMFYDFSLVIKLIFISLFVYLSVILLRYLWVYVQPNKFHIRPEYRNKSATLYALGGIHGTLTVAIALSIPSLYVTNNSFLINEYLVFVATLTILISIIVPTISFPLLLAKEDVVSVDFNVIKSAMLKHTIRELESFKNNFGMSIAIKILEGQLHFIENEPTSKLDRSKVKTIINKATKIELILTDKLLSEGKISKDVAIFYKAYISNLNKPSFKQFILKLSMARIKRKVNRVSIKYNNHDINYRINFINEFNTMEDIAYKEVLSYLEELKTTENYKTISVVIRYYNRRLGKDFSEFDISGKTETIKLSLTKAFEIENTFIEDSFEKGLISSSLAKELREHISYDKLIYLK